MGDDKINKIFDLTPILKEDKEYKEFKKEYLEKYNEFMEDACDAWDRTKSPDWAYDCWKDDQITDKE